MPKRYRVSFRLFTPVEYGKRPGFDPQWGRFNFFLDLFIYIFCYSLTLRAQVLDAHDEVTSF